jgi:hypothetical protein
MGRLACRRCSLSRLLAVACIVREFRQQEAIDTFQWPAMSLDMNTIEHVWDFIGRKVNQHNPQCQNIAELNIHIRTSNFFYLVIVFQQFKKMDES